MPKLQSFSRSDSGKVGILPIAWCWFLRLAAALFFGGLAVNLNAQNFIISEFSAANNSGEQDRTAISATGLKSTIPVKSRLHWQAGI